MALIQLMKYDFVITPTASYDVCMYISGSKQLPLQGGEDGQQRDGHPTQS